MGREGSLLVGVTGDSRAAERFDLLARGVETCPHRTAANGATGHVNIVSFPNLGDETIAIAIRLDGEVVAGGLGAWTRRDDAVLYAFHTNGSGSADTELVEWAMTTMLARLESN
jgi:hypothetical protein